MKPSEDSLKPSPNKLLPESDTHMHLDLLTFKVNPCKGNTNHLPKQCFYYHDYKKDRRRPHHLYIGDICPYISNNKECPSQENCAYAHNRVEEFYHPSKYKTKFCSTFPNHITSCEYNTYCCFAHSYEDITIDLLHIMPLDIDFYTFHFKTICVHSTKPIIKEICAYIHNLQCCRRNPNEYPYSKDQYEHWNSNKSLYRIQMDALVE